MLQTTGNGTWKSEKGGASVALGGNQVLWSFVQSGSDKGYKRTTALPYINSVIYYQSNLYHMFSPTKNYIFKTRVTKFGISSNVGSWLQFKAPFETNKGFYFTHSHKGAGSVADNYDKKYGYYPGVTGSYGWPEWSTVPVSSSDETTLIYMSRPTNAFNTNIRHAFYSSTFSGYINSIDVEETDWFFQGYSWGTSSTAVNDEKYRGWRYVKSGGNTSLKYQYNPDTTSAKNSAPFAVGYLWGRNYEGGPFEYMNRQTYTYTNNNYAARYIGLKKYNLSFSVGFSQVTTDAYLSVYSLPSLPSSKIGDTWRQDFSRVGAGVNSYYMPKVPVSTGISFEQSLQKGQFLGKITSAGTYNFYDVQGSSYLVFVSSYSGNITWNITVDKIEIKGGYSEIDNNKRFLISDAYTGPTASTYDNSTQLSLIGEQPSSEFYIENTTKKSLHQTEFVTFGLTGATGGIGGFYSDLYGTVTNIAQLYSKLGNGTFRAGIWENGVWNNGWRDDENVYEFTDVKRSIRFGNNGLKWRIQISGPTQSVSNFKVGDKVSISNIIAIDLNDNRKLFKNYFSVVLKDDTSLVFEAQTAFPFRRIEKDSENHKILVTKNVWLNGLYLNGYFQGVWNDGLFKGYPKITEMFDTHWIDGEFDGGHFRTGRVPGRFLDTYFWEGNVGLTFGTTKHGLKIGDIIEIDKDDKTINPEYDTKTQIIDIVDDYLAITDLPWGGNSSDEAGNILSQSTGLIQNFKFKDNNVATKTARDSKILKEIWNFNSFIDVNYDYNSTTNIGKNRQYYNQSTTNLFDLFNKYKLGIGDYSPLNLYGFVTNDVLTAEATFRDIDSNVNRKYSLGTKYEIYQDFLGDLSDFNSAFGTTQSLGGLDNFYRDGWTYSYSGSRLIYPRETVIEGETYSDKFLFFDNYYRIVNNSAKIGFIGTSSNLFSEVTVGEDIYISQFVEQKKVTGWNGGATYTTPTNATYSGKSKVLEIITLYPIGSTSSPTWSSTFTASVIVTDKNFIQNTPPEGGYLYYKKGTIPSFTFSRTLDGTFLIEHNENSLQNFVLNNKNINIEKNRYSVIEFDYLNGPENVIYSPQSGDFYDFHLIDLFNFTTFAELQNGELIYGPTHAFPSPPTSYNTENLAVWGSGVNYAITKPTKKVEYFYNRTSLDLGFISLAYYNQFGFTQSFNFEVDNIKFYEVDRVPFFQYATNDYVNSSVQVPYQGLAPEIDYGDEAFTFLDHIQIGIDSFIINESDTTITLTRPQLDLIFQPITGIQNSASS